MAKIQKLFNKMFDKNKTKEPDTNTKQSYLIEQYVLEKPENTMVDYRMFFDCSEIPVAYKQYSGAGFNMCLKLPNSPKLQKYLLQLINADNQTLQNPKTRNVSIVTVCDNKAFYILPNLENMKKPFLVPYKNQNKSWVKDVNSEINRAVVNQMKTLTR